MNRLISIVIIVFFTFNLYSQDVLTGVYVKDHVVERINNGEFGIWSNFEVPLVNGCYKLNNDYQYYATERTLQISSDFFVFPYTGKIKGLDLDSVKLTKFLNAQEINIQSCTFFNPSKYYRLIDKDFHPNISIYIESIKYYISKINELSGAGRGNLFSNKYLTFHVNNFTNFFEPFYLKKFEVTNGEYREFTTWVRDSITRSLLVDSGFVEYKNPKNNSLNWDIEIDWNSEDEEYIYAIKEIFIPVNERFYRRKEIDSRKLIYSFPGNNQEPVSIYPDTTVWKSDYKFIYDETRFKSYFWHSAFSEYPVVGVSWEQAKAFCNWKTKKLQEKFDREGLKYRVVVDLPSTFQREFVLTGFKNFIQSEDWLWDLIIDENEEKMEVGESYLWTYDGNSYYNNIFLESHEADLRKITKDGFFNYNKDIIKRIKKEDWYYKERSKKWNNNEKYVYLKNKEITKTQWENLLTDIDTNKISGLRSNVSEWMNETYSENWEPMYTKYRNMSDSINPDLDFDVFIPMELIKKDTLPAGSFNTDRKLESLKEANLIKAKYRTLYRYKYPFKKMVEEKLIGSPDSSYRLIKGSNWFDECFKRQKDLAQVKTFAPKNASYATVGFRYVVKLYPKE